MRRLVIAVLLLLAAPVAALAQGSISGNGTINQLAGTTILTGANTMSGPVNITGGTVNVSGGDVTADGISLKSHHHNEHDGPATSAAIA